MDSSTVECTVDISLIRARLRRRRDAPGVSDGREEILDDLVAAWEPVDEPGGWHLIVDTSQPLEDNMASLARRLPTWSPGLTE